jgi:adhesin HecA-like repeat protein
MPGLGKKTFTAGDVLIAGDVNNYLMDQTVMNFATVAARSSAIPVPSTGMVSYVGDTGSETPASSIPQIQAYTGAAWQNLDGLTLISNTSFASVASVTVDNVFTSTFQNYLVKFVARQNTSAGNHQMRLRASGVDNAAGFYGGGVLNYASSNTLNSYRMNGAIEYTCGSSTLSIAAVSVDFNIHAPQENVLTRVNHRGVGDDAFASYSHYLDTWYNAATQFDGIKILTTGGTISGSLRIYGYRN